MLPPDSSHAPIRAGKLLPLEALRGLAAVCVMFHHFSLSFLPEYTGLLEPVNPGKSLMGTPFFIVLNGKAMFIIFFVLSGYVLALKGHREDAWFALRDGAAKRWFRLAPLVCISAVISYVLFALGLYHFTDAAALTGSSWLRDEALPGVSQHSSPSLALAFYQGLFSTFLFGQCSLNSNLWTMRPELLGSYMVFTLALLLKPETRVHLWVLLAFMGAGMIAGYIWLFPFLLGVAGAALPLERTAFGKSVTLLMLATGLYLCGYYYPQGQYKWLSHVPIEELTLRYLVLSAGGVILLVVFATDNLVSRSFQGPVSRALGKISFPLYLLHTLVIASFCSSAYILAGGATRGVCAAALVLLVIVVPVAWALAGFDRWWLKLLSRWHPVKTDARAVS